MIYKIERLEDVFNVPPDRREACFKDIQRAMTDAETLFPTVPLHRISIFQEFQWIDDGKQEDEILIVSKGTHDKT